MNKDNIIKGLDTCIAQMKYLRVNSQCGTCQQMEFKECDIIDLCKKNPLSNDKGIYFTPQTWIVETLYWLRGERQKYNRIGKNEKGTFAFSINSIQRLLIRFLETPDDEMTKADVERLLELLSTDSIVFFHNEKEKIE